MPAPGSVIERVESRGKHLEIGWDDGCVLHTHMRMSGSWHLYRPGEHWRKSSKQMRVVIEVPGWQAVCFSAPVVETYRAGALTRHPVAGSLGPDLCKEDADIADCVARMARYCDAELTAAEALLDQRVACGVGNVYKSEVLWACELDPFTPVGALDTGQRTRLIEMAAGLLRANLDTPDARHQHGEPRGSGGVRPLRQAVPALQHTDRGAQARGAGPRHLLVPELPAVPAAARAGSRRRRRRRGRAAGASRGGAGGSGTRRPPRSGAITPTLARPIPSRRRRAYLATLRPRATSIRCSPRNDRCGASRT